MKLTENNFAFIDSQNLNLGIQKLGWHLDFKKFRVYLKEKYNITRAYLFIGYMPEKQSLYNSLQSYGYILIFKPTLKNKDGKVKGNCDADLVLQAMIDYNKFDKALIVTSDGDFYCLVEYFYKNDKLKVVMSPIKKNCSSLLMKTAREKIMFMDNLKSKLEFKREAESKKAPPRD